MIDNEVLEVYAALICTPRRCPLNKVASNSLKLIRFLAKCSCDIHKRIRHTFSNYPMQLTGVEDSKLCQTALQLFVKSTAEKIHEKVSGEITRDAVAIPACKRGQVHKKVLYK